MDGPPADREAAFFITRKRIENRADSHFNDRELWFLDTFLNDMPNHSNLDSPLVSLINTVDDSCNSNLYFVYLTFIMRRQAKAKFGLFFY
jgi:hypothetical protein